MKLLRTNLFTGEISMIHAYNAINEYGVQMPLSVACETLKDGDSPILVDGRIPFHTHYRKAEEFLRKRGYTFWEEPLGIVIEGSYESLSERFGGRLEAAK